MGCFHQACLRLLVLSLLFIFGCSSAHDRVQKKEIIPERDFVPILVDFHVANAFFSLSSLRAEYPGTDSISNYHDLLEQYGYTLDDFEKTVAYYEDHLEAYVEVYDQVMKKLQDIEREVKGSDQAIMNAPGQHNTNLWTMSTEYHLPREGRRNKIPFSIPVNQPGMYTFSVRIRLFRDDQSINPAINTFFWYDDGTEEGKSLPIKKQPLVKDNQVHLYILAGTYVDKKITHLKGFLLDDENKDTLYTKHADILDIRINLKQPASSSK